MTASCKLERRASRSPVATAERQKSAPPAEGQNDHEERHAEHNRTPHDPRRACQERAPAISASLHFAPPLQPPTQIPQPPPPSLYGHTPGLVSWACPYQLQAQQVPLQAQLFYHERLGYPHALVHPFGPPVYFGGPFHLQPQQLQGQPGQERANCGAGSSAGPGGDVAQQNGRQSDSSSNSSPPPPPPPATQQSVAARPDATARALIQRHDKRATAAQAGRRRKSLNKISYRGEDNGEGAGEDGAHGRHEEADEGQDEEADEGGANETHDDDDDNDRDDDDECELGSCCSSRASCQLCCCANCESQTKPATTTTPILEGHRLTELASITPGRRRRESDVDEQQRRQEQISGVEEERVSSSSCRQEHQSTDDSRRNHREHRDNNNHEDERDVGEQNNETNISSPTCCWNLPGAAPETANLMLEPRHAPGTCDDGEEQAADDEDTDGPQARGGPGQAHHRHSSQAAAAVAAAAAGPAAGAPPSGNDKQQQQPLKTTEPNGHQQISINGTTFYNVNPATIYQQLLAFRPAGAPLPPAVSQTISHQQQQQLQYYALAGHASPYQQQAYLHHQRAALALAAPAHNPYGPSPFHLQPQQQQHLFWPHGPHVVPVHEWSPQQPFEQLVPQYAPSPHQMRPSLDLVPNHYEAHHHLQLPLGSPAGTQETHAAATSISQLKLGYNLIPLLPISAIPTRIRQAYGMDKVWQDEFEQLFAQFISQVVWTLVEVETNPNIRNSSRILDYKNRFVVRVDGPSAPNAGLPVGATTTTTKSGAESEDEEESPEEADRGHEKEDEEELASAPGQTCWLKGPSAEHDDEDGDSSNQQLNERNSNCESDCDSGAVLNSSSASGSATSEAATCCQDELGANPARSITPMTEAGGSQTGGNRSCASTTNGLGSRTNDPTNPTRKFPLKFRMFIDSAKVRFCCETCGHGWTSMKGRVVFWYELFELVDGDPRAARFKKTTNHDQGVSNLIGYCAYKLFGQQCDVCKVENRFERPMWYPEEVTKVLCNLYNKIGQVYFGFRMPTIDKQRRAGKPKTSHNSLLCQACHDGVCTDRK